MHRIVPVLLFAACLLFVPGAGLAATVVDQSQPTFTQTGDLASSGRSGQTFTAGISGAISGIRLVVAGKGFSGPVFGSDFVLSLRPTANGTPSESILAAASFSKSGLQRDVAQWITLTFDTPYQHLAGEVLAFTVQELSGGGANGFNYYGAADGNLYSGGQMFFMFTAGQPLGVSTRDFAFETLVVPEPSMGVLAAFGAVSILATRQRRTKSRSP